MNEQKLEEKKNNRKSRCHDFYLLPQVEALYSKENEERVDYFKLEVEDKFKLSYFPILIKIQRKALWNNIAFSLIVINPCMEFIRDSSQAEYLPKSEDGVGLSIFLKTGFQWTLGLAVQT